MKILHFADIHLDDTNHEQVYPALQFIEQEALKINRKGIPAVIDVATGIDMSHFKRAE